MMEEIFYSFPQKIINTYPKIFWAILIFIVGILVACWAGKIFSDFLRRVRLDQLFKRVGWEEALTKINGKFLATDFFGGILKWFLLVVFLWFSSEIMGTEKISRILMGIITYFPNVFIAAFIFVASVFLADCSQKIVVGTLEKEKIVYSDFLGKIIRWAIWFFAVLAIFYQLKIVSTLILIIFIGLVIAVSLALGISLGLGGKDLAKKILEEIAGKFK